MMMKRNIFLYGLLILISFACKTPDNVVKIRFDSIDREIKKGAQLLWKGVAIGKVVKVKVSARGVLVLAAIDKEYKNKIVADSLFYLNRSGAIEYHVLDPDSGPPEKEEILRGTDNRLELLKLKGERYLEDMADGVKTFKSEELEEFFDSLEDAMESGKEKLDEEILPSLKKYLEEMKEKLERFREKQEDEEPKLI